MHIYSKDKSIQFFKGVIIIDSLAVAPDTCISSKGVTRSKMKVEPYFCGFDQLIM